MGKIKNRFEKILKKNNVGKIYLYIDTSGSIEVEKEYECPLREVIETVVEKGLPLRVNLFTHELYLSTEFFGMKKDELYDAIINLDMQCGGTDFTDGYNDVFFTAKDAIEAAIKICSNATKGLFIQIHAPVGMIMTLQTRNLLTNEIKNSIYLNK